MRKKQNKTKQKQKQKATGKLKLKHICMKTLSSYYRHAQGQEKIKADN